MIYCLEADCCAYLKKKCDFRYSHYDSPIQQIYKDVLGFLLNEKKPIPRDRVDGKKSSQSQIKQLTYIFNYFEGIQVNSTKLFLCSKTYKSSKDSIHLIFRCQECGIEEGSVSCVRCFNVEDHKNHQFELIKVPGGSCDCGNYSKWQKVGTCKRHQVNGELEQEPDQINIEKFQDNCNHFLSIFCRLYLAFKARQSQILQLQNQNTQNKAQLQKQRQGLKYIQNLVDTFGSYFVNTLVRINNNHLVFNNITRKWMQQILRLPDFPQIEQAFIEERPIMFMLMRFLQMKKTGRACSELYLRLLNRSEQWTKNIAIQYFKVSRLPHFFFSGFSQHFTPQILGSSKLIKELIDSNQIEFLIFNTQLRDNPSQQELDKFHAQHQIFLHNLGYLLEMKQAAFKTYWIQFTQSFGFESLFTYYEIFNRSEFHLRLAHRKYFYLEESALKRTIKIIDKMDGDQKFIVVNLRKLTHELFKLYELNQYKKKFKENNLFFTYERIWAVFLFAYFYCYKRKTSCNELSKAEIEELFNNIYSFEQAPKQNQQKLKSFMRILQRLLQELIRRFFRIGQVMKSQSTRREHLKFVWSYFMQSNLLYSVDSFMLVMILQISRAYNTKLDSVLKELLDSYLNRIDLEFRKQIANQQQIKSPVVAMHTFVFLIIEPIYFKYQDLIILAHFKKLATNHRYQQLFIDFYSIIHNAWYQKGRSDTLPQFKESFQSLFFAEDYFFHQFITKQQVQPSLVTGKEQRINIQYFFALSYKIGKQGCSNKYNIQQSFKQIPKSLRRNLGIQVLSSSVHLEMVRQWLRELTEVGDIAKSMKSRVNQLVTQLYKVMMMTGSASYQIYFSDRFENIDNIFNIVSGLIKQDVKEYNPQHILSIYRSLDCLSLNSRLHLSDSNFRQQFDQRLEYLRKLDSQTNKKEANLDRYNDQKCMFLKKCQHPREQVVYQMCFINITNLLEVFQIDKLDKYLCFSTCGHLVHKQCYENQRKEQQSNILYCHRCHRVYNFIISPLQTQHSNFIISPLQTQHSTELIGQDVSRISSFLKQHKVEKPVQLEIVRALMAFLLINITVDDFNQLRKNMLIYKNLFAKLKMWSQIQGYDLKQRQVKFSSKMHAQLMKVIWQSIASFGENTCQVTNSKEYLSYKGQIDYIRHILSFFYQKSSKWSLREPSSYFIQTETNINLGYFPSTLLQLNQNRKCILCNSRSKHSYYICLSHASNQTENSPYCVCFQDLKEWVTKHLTEYQKHMDECVMIRTDTGEIHLFHMDTNEERKQIWERVQPSVYLDDRKNSYQVEKKYKLEDFRLDPYKVKKTINSFRSWNTVLKIIKLQ